ncbi:MAG: glycosyltransferase family 4 protein [Bacteroidota bacterium]|nr:glycosyltransferase family 4 protein [Bacteroidota bacterium]
MQEEIVIFTDWYVPGYKAGGPIQSVYNLVELLSKHYHVKVITRNTDYQSNKPYSDIVADEWVKVKENQEVFYCSSAKLSISLIKQFIKLNKDKRILINGLFSFYFSFLPLLFVVILGVKKSFVAVRGMLHQSALSVKPIKKQIFLAFARGFGLYKSTVLLSTSVQETKEIKMALGGKVNIQLIKNIPLVVKDLNISEKHFKNENNQLKILFLGRISEEKNAHILVDALQNYPLPIKVVFCGAYVNQVYFNEFEKKLNQLPNHIQYQYINDLPHQQIETLFFNSDILVLPSLGENFGHAIFESFAFATPVIIGNNTPWKNIEEKQIGIEINPNRTDELIQAIRFFHELSPSEYLVWQNNAYQFAKTYFNSNNFEELYLNLFS